MARTALIGAAVAGVLASASAFAPGMGGTFGSPSVRQLDAVAKRAGRPRPAHESPRMADMGVVNTLAGFPLMYVLMSANEYVTHRYYQHNEVGKLEIYQTLRKMDKIPKLDGGGHIEHRKPRPSVHDYSPSYDFCSLQRTDTD